MSRTHESTIRQINFLLMCRFCSVGCMHSPRVQYTIPISQYKAQSGHCLFKEVSWSSKISVLPISVIKFFDSFTEMVDLLCLFKVFQQHIPVWVIFKLFDQSLNRFSAICVHLFNSGVWYAWDSEIDVAATGSPVLTLFAFIVVGFSRIGVRWILTTMLQIWREYDAR